MKPHRRNPDVEAIVLAGGMGTRLQSVVTDLPKPLAPVAGRPFLEYLMDYWLAQGITHFILSVGHKHELIEKHFGKKYKTADVDYSVERELLGTGGGARLAAEKIKGSQPVLVLNGDTIFEMVLANFLAQHLKHKAEVSIALAKAPENRRSEKVERSADGRITAFRQREEESDSDWINSGVYFFDPAFLKVSIELGKKLSLEKDFFPALIKNHKRVYGVPFEDRFIDMGTPESYAAMEKFIKRV